MVGSILLTWLTALGLVYWCGWGLTRLALPGALRPFQLMLMPLIGYCVVIWCGYQATHLGLSLRTLMPWLLGSAGLLNLSAWKRRPPQFQRQLLLHLVYPVPLIVFITMLAGVLPLFAYGMVTLIGGGWDGESYFALATHLQDYAVSSIAQAPTSPLRDHVINPPIIGLSMGMSLFHGSVAFLSGQSAFETFVPLLAWLRALGFMGVYVWLRAVMGLNRGAATWAIALGSAGALLLWVTFFNFGMQLGAWPLIALVLVLSVGAVEAVQQHGWQASWPGLVLAALSWATLPITYYPALTVAVPMALGLALALLLQARPTFARTALAMLALITLILPLSTWVVSDYFAGFAYRYANALTTLGLFHFIPLSDIFGLSAFHLQEPSAPSWISSIGMIVAGALMLAGLARGPQRTRWSLTLLGALGYIVWMRWGREYHYAYIKGAAYVHFALMGLVAAGWQACMHMKQLKGLASPLLAGLFILLVLAQTSVLRDHWNQPKLQLAAPAALDRFAAQLEPPQAPIYLAPATAWNGPAMSAIAAALYPHPLWGHVFTAYSTLDQPAQGVPAYLLLDSATTPTAQGLPPATQLWNAHGLSIWQVDQAQIGWWQRGRRLPLPVNDARQTPAGTATLGWGGPLQTINEPHVFNFPDHTLQTFMAQVAVLTPTTVVLSTSNSTASHELAAGVTTVHHPAAAAITISSEQPIGLLQAHTTFQPPAESSLKTDSPWLVWQPQLHWQHTTFDLSIEVANPARHALRGELAISENRWNGSTPVTLVAPLPLTGSLQLSYDLAGSSSSSTALLNTSAPALDDGSYQLVWSIVDGSQRIQHVVLGVFEVADGMITNSSTWADGLDAVRLPSIPTDAPLQHVAVGEHYLLQAATWPTHTSQPQNEVLLYWQFLKDHPDPAFISVQVLDETQRKWAQWDGPIGGWYSANESMNARSVTQSVPLTFDAATPPGSYQLLIAAYDPTTGAPVLIDGQTALSIGTIEVR